MDDEKAAADFNTYHSTRAARRPLDAVAEDLAEAPGEPLGSNLTVNRDVIVYGGLGIGVLILILWAVFR